MNRIPIYLLTGYLGAGKTTLLNHLLSLPGIRDRNPAMIINEFGTLGVDGEQVSSGAGRLFELNKGSLFCICIKTDFIKTMQTIAEDVRPDLLIVEATGVAETRDLEDFLDVPGLRERFKIQANVCIVDAANFLKVAPYLKAARGQVEWADGVVVNKTDLAPDGELPNLLKVLKSFNPEAPMVDVQYGAIPADFLESLHHKHRKGDEIKEPPQAVFSISFKTDKPVDRSAFYEAIDNHRDKVLRLKGHVDFGEGPIFFEKAGDRTMEKAPRPGKSGTAFVVIAWNARQAELEETFRKTWGESADAASD